MVRCYFFALWIRANVQSKIWAQGSKKGSTRIASDSQQKHGMETTQHVNGGAVVKSPINKRGSGMMNYACVSRKRERVDAFILLTKRK